MCIQDWRLGSLMRPKFTQFTLAAGTITAANPDPNRVAINFAMVNGTLATTQFAFLQPDGNTAFELNSVVRFFNCRMDEYGDLPRRRWDITYSGVNHDMAMIEWFLPQEYLAIPLDLFRTDYRG